MPQLPIADFLFQWRQQIKRDVGWLEVFRIGMRNVVEKCTHHGSGWEGNRLSTHSDTNGINSRHQASRSRADIALGTGYLPSKE